MVSIATIFYSIIQPGIRLLLYITTRSTCIRKNVFYENSCLYVDIVLTILNGLSMFIFVHNSLRALGTLGPVLDLF